MTGANKKRGVEDEQKISWKNIYRTAEEGLGYGKGEDGMYMTIKEKVLEIIEKVFTTNEPFNEQRDYPDYEDIIDLTLEEIQAKREEFEKKCEIDDRFPHDENNSITISLKAWKEFVEEIEG